MEKHPPFLGQLPGPGQAGQFGEHPLGFPEGVAEEEAGTFPFSLPPFNDSPGRGFAPFPAVDRHGEGGFGDKGIAGHRFEGLAARIIIALEIPGNHPHLAAAFHPHLGGPGAVTRGMQGYPAVSEFKGLPEVKGFQADRGARPSQPMGEEGGTGAAAEIGTGTRTGVVRMGVGDKRPGDRTPGVDPEAAGPAVQAAFIHGDKVHVSTVYIILTMC